MKNEPALDGLRAVAIIPVLVFHTFPGCLPGGFTGVDVFFTLSGFLITSLIARDLQREKFVLSEFYLRRILRLLPNLVLMIAVATVAALVLLPPSGLGPLVSHGIWAVFSASNLFVWRTAGNYWGDAANSMPLLHTWSLGVEEQFYFVFPVTLYVIGRYASRHRIFLVALLGIVSFSVSLIATYRHPSAAFYLLPTRMWELLLGCSYALWVGEKERDRETADSPEGGAKFGWGPTAGGWLGVVLILFGAFAIKESAAFPGWLALIPTLGTLLAIHAVMQKSASFVRWLSHPVPVGIGLVSYSLYLWHWPGIVLGRKWGLIFGYSERLTAPVGCVLGIILAILAYHFVESPMRRGGLSRRFRLGLLGSSVGAFVVAGPLLPAWERRRLAAVNAVDHATFSGPAYSVASVADARGAVRYEDVIFPTLPENHGNSWRNGGLIFANSRGSMPQVVVLGSSHALMYSPMIRRICQEKDLSVAFMAVDGLPVLPGKRINVGDFEGAAFDAARRKWLGAWRPATVLIIDRWDRRLNSEKFAADFEAFVTEMEQLCTGSVVVLTQVPALSIDENESILRFANWYYLKSGKLPEIAPDDEEPVRRRAAQIFEEVARRHPRLAVVYVEHRFFNDDHSVVWRKGRTLLYADRDHLSDQGAEQVQDLIASAIGLSENR